MGISRALFVIAALCCAGLLLPGCPGDETVNEYYQMPGFVRVTTDYLPDVQVGTAYAETVEAQGGSNTFTWSIETGGTNDSWLSIDNAGQLTGTPGTAGQVIVTVRVEDAEDATKYDTERFVFTVTPLPVPSFPGTDVADNNHAPDGAAFSPSMVDADITGGGRMFLFCNHANGTGILLAKMVDDATSPNAYSLWASYFDGTEMTPMVELRGEMQNPAQDFSFGHCRVVFLNISGDPRDGDAVILFTRTELDTVADVRLYSAYFDASEAPNAVSASNADVQYGFDTAADFVNDDPDGRDVHTVGFVTDGLYMMSVRFRSDFEFYLQGNPVTYVGAVWTETGPTSGRMYSADFDLTTANTDNDFTPAKAKTPAFRTLGTSDSFVGEIHVTGDCVVYTVVYNQGGADDDTVVEVAKYDPSTADNFTNTAWITRDDSTDGVIGGKDMEVFGSVEGLARVYVMCRESGYDDSGENADKDLMLSIYDPFDGSTETREIDFHSGNTNIADVHSFRASLNRPGDLLFIAWRQQYQDAVLGTDSLFLQAVQTIRTGGSARTLNDSILLAPVVMNSDTTSDNAMYLDYADVTDFTFDNELMYLFGNQSNHLRCNVLFLQEPDSATDSDNLVLRLSYAEITLDTGGSSPPTADAGSGAATEEDVWTNDTDFPFWSSPSMDNFLCVDSGEAGVPVVYFVGDGDALPTSHTPGNAVEPRLFCYDSRSSTYTGATEISGDCADSGEATLGFSNSRQVFDPGNGALQVTTMPYQAYDGTNPDVSASYHNILFMEQRDVPGSTSMLRHRCLDLGLTASATADQFYPALTAQPFDVSADAPRGTIAFLGQGPTVQNATTLAVYFKQGTHLWYNEYQPGSSSTWVQENGLSAPYLVDDDAYPGDAVLTWNMMVIAPFTIGTFDLLDHLPTFYVKALNPIGGFGPLTRIFCRIHD